MVNQIIELDFGKVYFKKNILIAEINEGILFDVEHNRILLEIGKHHFDNQNYGYISYRVNSYAVNPMVYLESASFTNLRAIAVVSTNPTCKQNAVLERQFYKEHNSFEVFSTLEDAIAWISIQIKH